ncbi:MAG TPA: IS3 family transposase [Terriglobales bacterium]|jgi:putative transposase
MPFLKKRRITKKELARSLGIARSTLYYSSKLLKKDWDLKIRIENVLHDYPAYGHKRLAIALSANKKRVHRVMHLFGLKPYRRRPKKPWKKRDHGAKMPYPNLLLAVFPSRPDAAWVSDFTYIRFRSRWLYLATIMDLFTRTIVGLRMLTVHTVDLTLGALQDALQNGRRPKILHSDQGSEYGAKRYTRYAEACGIHLSMSREGSPWENGYQESFYSQFKLDLGDPNRFESLGELVAEIYRLIFVYNHFRIHSKLKMPPAVFAARYHELTKGRTPP